MKIIEKIKAFVSRDFEAVNRIILEHAKSADIGIVDEVAGYLMQAGGKRIRPLLTLLSASLFNYQGQGSILLASAVEFIHAATLLHDDVIDESSLRHAQLTAHKVWGNKTTILVGDYLFSQAFKLMVETNEITALQILAEASSKIVAGELMQLVSLQKQQLISESEYYSIISAKTATLFGAAGEVGAVISARKGDRDAIKTYATLLGEVFQLQDDIMDYQSSPGEMGKNQGDDFFEAKVTLPFILLSQKIRQLSDAQYEDLINSFFSTQKTVEDLHYIQKLMEEHNTFQDIANIIARKTREALYALDSIEDINLQAKELMKELIIFAGTRRD